MAGEDDSPQNSKKIFGIDVPENLEPITIILENTGEGDTVRFRSDDIEQEILDKLGDHAHRITKEAGNSPAIKIGSKKISTRSASGNPVPISDFDNNAESSFKEDNRSAASQQGFSNFEDSSDSGLLKTKVRKGKTDDVSLPTGTELIDDINQFGKDSTLAQDIREVQVANNRYACEDEYIDPEDFAREQDEEARHSQPEGGADGRPVGDEPDDGGPPRVHRPGAVYRGPLSASTTQPVRECAVPASKKRGASECFTPPRTPFFRNTLLLSGRAKSLR